MLTSVVSPPCACRYDFDHGGTLNSTNELENLLVNLSFSYGQYMAFPPQEELRAVAEKQQLSDSHEMSLGQFQFWFNTHVRARSELPKEWIDKRALVLPWEPKTIQATDAMCAMIDAAFVRFDFDGSGEIDDADVMHLPHALLHPCS